MNKRIIRELAKTENNKDLILYEAEFISMASKEKQNTLIKKMREIARENTAFANRTILKFNWN